MSDFIVMGKDGDHPKVHDGMRGIRISLDTQIDHYWTKCNHLGVDVITLSKKKSLFIKGFQVIRRKYRLAPISELLIQEKLPIIEYLRKLV